MILKQNTTPTIVSEGLESSVMGINANKIAMLSRILRDSIYSDKIGGCVREYDKVSDGGPLTHESKHDANPPFAALTG